MEDDGLYTYCPYCGTVLLSVLGKLKQFCPECAYEREVTV